MPTVLVYPGDDDTNGWATLLPRRVAQPALVGEFSADWVVVGAGFAGLAAARRLAHNRPDDFIVLLDAQCVGEGTSGRNSGFAIDLPVTRSNTASGLEASRKRVGLSRAAIEYLETSITESGIECQWRKPGKYHAAATPRGARLLLQPFMQELDALGEPYRLLGRETIFQETGTNYYEAAVHTPGGALMNPVSLTRGLADALPANVRLFENSPVTHAEYDDGVRIQTRAGGVQAQKMILATNAFAPQFGFYRHRLMPIALHASLTRQLSDEEHGTLGGVADWGLTSAPNSAGVTVRYTPDRRILIRQIFEYCPSFRISGQRKAEVRRLHQEAFAKRFPMLPDVEIDKTWTGFVCLSRNRAPGFGQVHPNVFSAVCQNSLGVTMGTIAGLLAADMGAGRPNPLIADLQSFGSPKPLPPEPLLAMGIAARFAWDVWWTGSEF